jgi:23S rRNA-/tRNA-specific pseudouridylate synthase
LIAKDADVARALSASWDRFEKRYLAVALGSIPERRRFEAPLSEKDGRLLAARTEVEPLAALTTVAPAATLLEVRLETGRMHQIRRHLAGARHPVLLDDKYGDFAANKAWARAVRDAGGPKPKHLMLHAWRVRLWHPGTGAPLELRAPPPPFWREALVAAGAGVDALARLS